MQGPFYQLCVCSQMGLKSSSNLFWIAEWICLSRKTIDKFWLNFTAIWQAIIHIFNRYFKMTIKSSFSNELLLLWEIVIVMINR